MKIPKIVTLIAVIFAVFAIYDTKQAEAPKQVKAEKVIEEGTTNEEVTPAPEAPINKKEQNFVEKKMQNLLVNTIRTKDGQVFLDKIIEEQGASFIRNEEDNKKLKLIGIVARANATKDKMSSLGARCGQDIVMRMKAELDDGIYVVGKKDEFVKYEFRLGDRTFPPEIEHALVGLEPGYQYKINLYKVMPEYLNRFNLNVTPKKQLKIDYIIDNISPYPLESSKKIRVYEMVPNEAQKAECGDRVYVSYKLSDMGGKVLAQQDMENPVLLKIGSIEVPYGVNKVLEGMYIGSERNALIPGEYLTNMYGKESQIFKSIKFDNNLYYIFDIYLKEKHEL